MRLRITTAVLVLSAGLAAQDAPSDTVAPAARTAAVIAGGRPFTAAATLTAGYDSNILFEPDVNPDTSDTKGASLSADVSGTLRIIDAPGHGLSADHGRGRRLAATVAVGLREYPGHSAAELARAAATIAGHQHVGAWDPGFVLGYHRYWLDGEAAADVVNAEIFASRIESSFQHIDIGLVGAELISYPQKDDKSGVLASVSARHWYLPERKNIRRRIEASLTASLMAAHARYESYYGIAPGIGALWRFGTGERLGTSDASAAVSYEFRSFPDTGGRQGILLASAGWDAWLCANATIGLYGSFNRRTSDEPAGQYGRYQAGVRLGVTW